VAAYSTGDIPLPPQTDMNVVVSSKMDDTFKGNCSDGFWLVSWLPDSLDLTSSDYFVCGFVKDFTYAQRPQDFHQLKTMTASTFTQIAPETTTHGNISLSL
jgi:hypothetical protein